MRRVLAHWRLKLLLTGAVNVLFWAGYGFLGRNAFFPLWRPPLTWFDVTIPFQPEIWGWVYLSLYVCTTLLPWLIDTREMIMRFVIGILIMSGLCFAVFILLPVESPRPAEMGTATGAVRWILAYDGTMNAFPSLHAGFIVYMGLLARRMFGPGWPTWVSVATMAWAAAILYATIAVRQHYAIDLLAGAVVGAVADWLAWRGAGVRVAITISRSSGVAFQDGCK